MDNQVAEIKSKIDIVSIIGERIDLKKAGRNYKANCPFHGEKTPSFMVSPELQIFKCFGCSESGDAFSFLEKYEGMDFPEALKYLADFIITFF
ncbi:MAG: primase protein [Microgenomates group bacterium GW2011_GWC1_39_7b]|nr:MAG: primase protein [Microgenomates group bacterium GW2011_GWC1_39_7b]